MDSLRELMWFGDPPDDAQATLVVDAFHVIRLANAATDDVRRRV